MFVRVGQLLIWAKYRAGILAKDERGDFGIGQIAAIVAGIVIVGVVVATVTEALPNWIGEVWGWIKTLIVGEGA